MVEEKKEDHLPLYGVGPAYNYGVIGVTIVAILCRNLSFLRDGKLTVLRTPFFILGVLLIIFSLYMWGQAVTVSKIFQNIEQNKLVTTGVFSWVRNPIYSSAMILCTGMLFMAGNAYLFILPVIFWAALTILMINTEEKWLRELYGKEYDDYCQQVNRCIPFPRNLKGLQKKSE